LSPNCPSELNVAKCVLQVLKFAAE
jgi:hypothetical protein